MQILIQGVSLLLFVVLVVLPSAYGFHMYLLMYLAHRRRRHVRAEQRQVVEQYQRETAPEDWPVVTTQLPLYNELTVARRIIRAAAHMDYPRDRHEIQVLDDSTDETRQIVDQVADELRRAGHDIKVVRRPNREHYKAGALAYGVKQARGEYIAIFDADFAPDPGFLRRMIPLIEADENICTVQGRWGHLNADQTWITEALSLGMDLHFSVEQGARNWNGLLMSFNGTGGIWRRKAIDDPRVGGWSGDTITEDLDLSYRAQLAGWRMVYCVDEVCPAELPADVSSLKTQQRRWATGTIQTARKLLPRIWHSDLTLARKLQATIHMTQYTIALPMVLVALCGRLLPLVLTGDAWPVWIQWLSVGFLAAALAPVFAYIYARHSIGGGIPGPGQILKLIALGLGLCVNNALAVITGLVQRGGEFVRTPKSGSTGQRGRQSVYKSLHSRLWIFELLLGAFCFAQWLVFLSSDGYVGGTFLLLYAIGLTAIGWGSRPDWVRQPTINATKPTGSKPEQRGSAHKPMTAVLD